MRRCRLHGGASGSGGPPGKRAASTCIRGVTGVRNALALPMVGGRLKGSPCLQRADERHTLVNALGRTSYTPNPRSLRDFGTPLSRRPNPHALGGVLVACAQALRTERAYSLSSSFG
jgi:hypothetical protein